MNPDPAADVDDLIDAMDTDDEETYHYGAPDPSPWYSSWEHDGRETLVPRRPEITGDSVDALMSDLSAWVEWLVVTFRIQARIAPCWMRHGALREELLALFFLWQDCWLPAKDPGLPVAFLREFDASLSRIERYWKVPCDATTHKEPTDIAFTSNGVASWKQWWANPEFNDTDAAVAELQPREGDRR